MLVVKVKSTSGKCLWLYRAKYGFIAYTSNYRYANKLYCRKLQGLSWASVDRIIALVKGE